MPTCPQCGTEMLADSPHGVCPRCFLQLGAGAASQESGRAETTAARRFIPPKPRELSQHFPSLEILDLIGQGGMGAVYKARQRGLDRLVALKILPPDAAEDPTFAERFGREARALAKLNHPNIVGIYDSGIAGGLYYFVMEYVEGVNLREALNAQQFAAKEALTIVPQICEALQYAHDQGVVHRDIKPENVLLDKNGSVKVADFGLARLLGQPADEFSLTGTHQVLGTPKYMSPEQMEGARGIDHRADIYSLGVVFYEMLTGELPLGRFEPPSQKIRLDVRLDEVVLKTLEKEPGRRYQQASQIKSDVEAISGIGIERFHPEIRRQIRRMYGYEYRSKTTIMGWPLVHVATGIDPTTHKRRIARGVVAVGDVAIGAVAVGGVAVGGLVLAGCAFGLFTVGGLSLGLLTALGGAAIGMGLSVGGFALGSVAIGGCAVGIFALGGGAFGLFPIGPNAADPIDLEVLGLRLPKLLPWLFGAVIAALLAGVALFEFGTLMGLGFHSGRRHAAKQDHHRPSSMALITLFFSLLVLPCLLGIAALLLVYLSFRA